MARLIDADALKAIRFHDLPYSQIVPADCDTDEKVYAYKLGWNDAIDAIVESAPAVDPVKHGHWRDSRDTGVIFMECSVCKARAKKYAYLGAVGTNGIRFCPYCGAKMDEVET